MIIPKTGATTIKTAIFSTPETITTLVPALAIPAPTRPPTKVCEELDGNPHHHVSKFHVIAANNAAAIVVRSITSGLITPLPIVVATFKLKNKKAMKLKNAAHATAGNGDNTFVDTTVAIELAESWNPLMKSNIKTKAITTYKNSISRVV